MENQGMESRMTIIEARLAFCEQRLAVMERSFGGIILSTRRRKRELTPEEKKAVRARLIAGQERKRAEREAEAQAQAQAQAQSENNGKSRAARSSKKEVKNE